MGDFPPILLIVIVPVAVLIVVAAIRGARRHQGALISGGKKLNKKLGLASLIIMLLGILGLTNLVNPLL